MNRDSTVGCELAETVTSKCFSGNGPLASTGTKVRAPLLRRKVTWACCSGRGRRAARGMVLRVVQQPLEADLMCLDGRGATATIRTHTCTLEQPRAVT